MIQQTVAFPSMSNTREKQSTKKLTTTTSPRALTLSNVQQQQHHHEIKQQLYSLGTSKKKMRG